MEICLRFAIFSIKTFEFTRWCNYFVNCTAIALTKSTYSVQNALSIVWEPGSARTRWGAWALPKTL